MGPRNELRHRRYCVGVAGTVVGKVLIIPLSYAANILRPHGLFPTLLGKRFGGIEREAYDSDLARIVGESGNQFMATCLGESE
jgi:hypothetical protein